MNSKTNTRRTEQDKKRKWYTDELFQKIILIAYIKCMDKELKKQIPVIQKSQAKFESQFHSSFAASFCLGRNDVCWHKVGARASSLGKP